MRQNTTYNASIGIAGGKYQDNLTVELLNTLPEAAPTRVVTTERINKAAYSPRWKPMDVPGDSRNYSHLHSHWTKLAGMNALKSRKWR